MKLQLTDAVTGSPMIVETDDLRLCEPLPAPAVGTHIVFDSLMGRQVKEGYDQVCACVGAATVPAAIAATLKAKKK